jgi:ketosteroid isomerase-like protein
MADDVVFLTPGHPPMRGKAAFAAGQAALKQFRIDATSEVQEIRVLGAWACCWTQLSVVITPATGWCVGQTRSDTLSILQKQPNGAGLSRVMPIC